MIVAAHTSPAPPGTSLLVCGAAFVLLGCAMAMATRWPVYSVAAREEWLEKWGLRISFAGAVGAVVGAAEPMWASGEYPVVSGVLFAVALAMSALLLAPIVLSCPTRVEEDEAEDVPCETHQEVNGATVASIPIAHRDVHQEHATEGKTDLGEPPKVHPKPG